MKLKIQRQRLLFFGLIVVDLILAVVVLGQVLHWVPSLGNFQVLNPKGTIAAQERQLLITAVLIMLIAAIPVYFLLFFFAFRYRADKPAAKYSPNMQSGHKSTVVLWAILIAIVSALGILNWKSTHALDPYKPIASNTKPLTIQVVALEWKWLFIYPDQNIATVNYLRFPKGTPINFELTADAPMSSFWIPQLGSQIYAMPGMQTRLSLMADQAGKFNGSGTEINGPGFAGMKFIAESGTDADFNTWVQSIKSSNNNLDQTQYQVLAKPTENNPQAFYSSIDQNLYQSIIEKYMGPPQIKDDD